MSIKLFLTVVIIGLIFMFLPTLFDLFGNIISSWKNFFKRDKK